MSLVIQEHARARLITDGPDPRLVPVELTCDTDAPQTVHVRLPGGVDWAFGRDLLEGGLRAPVTRDDIRVWPCGRAQLVLELHSPDGVAVFQFDVAPLIRFLHRTHEAIERRTPAPAPPPAAPAPAPAPAASVTRA
ncbi:SsgA family sporulation/cell division regulator [Streptomyces sp. NBC_00683]|uniref:SsgA family sporulation/cell division regulator n=1 Tax=Streptomyces sp. NBC_00683 TaxID=2903670 RepID=UPI002E35F04D|nr:SsgA family sporulation/cell division regulator [Streptomyces sp. NBC_00683]